MAHQSAGLFEHLYTATKPAHQALERSLHLLRRPIMPSRIERALARFLGFHLVWESHFASSSMYGEIMTNRRRTNLAAADLLGLGLSQEQIDCLPRCDEATKLHRSVEVTMGSLYVMEGSTLGGAVIASALREESWLPPQGLQYFSPPGRQPRNDWTELKAWAEARFESVMWPLIEQGAQETFTLMNTWQSTL